MSLKLYEKNINLTDSTKLIQFEDKAPLRLIINPFNMKKTPTSTEFEFSSKFYKIVYDWGDGVIETQKAIPASFSDVASFNYPFVKEKGDPRNFIKEHIYTLTSDYKKSIDISVSAYMYGVSIPLVYKFRLLLNAPRLDGSKTGFFKNFHLIHTKMFDFDNKILYVFEGKDPSWIFPVLVDWRKRTGTFSPDEFEDYNKYQLNI